MIDYDEYEELMSDYPDPETDSNEPEEDVYEDIYDDPYDYGDYM